MSDLPEGVLAKLDRPICAYVYDSWVARDRVASVRAALPDGAAVLYAMKANGHPGLVAALAGAADGDAQERDDLAWNGGVDGVEVASGGELAIALAAGARRIAFGGPGKTDAELRAVVTAARDVDVTVNVESVTEVHRLTQVADGTPIRVGLRVNRRVSALPGSHQMTGTPTQFGIDETSLPDVVGLAVSPRARSHGLVVDGFHLHAVSNNLDARAHAAFIRDAVAWSRATANRFGIELRQVNVGGGLGIDYTGDAAFDLSLLAEGLRGLDLGDAQLVLEPGRFVAAPAGWYAAEVLDLKHTHGRWFAVLRGGTHHFRLPAAWGYSHPFHVIPVDRWDYPWPRPGVTDVDVDAVGELCTPRDVLTRGQRVNRLRIGDVLVFANSGAYGWDISHHDFLHHPYPQTVLI